jgi:hypothetical protein
MFSGEMLFCALSIFELAVYEEEESKGDRNIATMIS